MPPSPHQFEAQVIATFGRHAEVRDAEGNLYAARPFGRKLALVCGDRVTCERENDETHILATLPRTNALYRTTARGDSEAVVANITDLVAVIAPLPAPDPFVIDRYLCAATSGGIRGVLVLNKIDLVVDASLDAELNAYEKIGFKVVRCTALEDSHVDVLARHLQSSTSVLVGQSGVGKSSLLRRLVPTADAAVGELVRTTDEGRHTTTASRLYDLPHGGHLIDSPGVRDFAPAIDHLEPTSLGFLEVARLAPGCRFQDCRHMKEPHCAVIAGVANGEVFARRYESYRRLRRLYEELLTARGPAPKRPGRRH